MAYSIDIYGDAIDTNSTSPRGTCLIDFSSLAISTALAYAGQEKVKCVPEGMLRHLVLTSILRVRRLFKNEYPELVVACDADHYWRKDVFPYYKAHRQGDRDNSEFDWDRLHKSLDSLIQEIKHVFPFKVLLVDKAEADDIIGVITSQYKHPMMIYAKDGDYHQCLMSPNVKLFNPFTQKLVPKGDVEKLLLEKIIRGDSGDGIPNILSVPNSFVDKIRQSQMTQKRLDAFMSNPEELKDNERFKQNEELISFSKIPSDLIKEIIKAYEQAPINSNDKMKVFTYLTQESLSRIGGRLSIDIDLFC